MIPPETDREIIAIANELGYFPDEDDAKDIRAHYVIVSTLALSGYYESSPFNGMEHDELLRACIEKSMG